MALMENGGEGKIGRESYNSATYQVNGICARQIRDRRSSGNIVVVPSPLTRVAQDFTAI